MAAFPQVLTSCQTPLLLVLLPGGHFDPYLSRFDESSTAARDWFRRHLA